MDTQHFRFSTIEWQEEQLRILDVSTYRESNEEFILVQGVAGSGKTTIALKTLQEIAKLNALYDDVSEKDKMSALLITYNEHLVKFCKNTLIKDGDASKYLADHIIRKHVRNLQDSDNRDKSIRKLIELFLGISERIQNQDRKLLQKWISNGDLKEFANQFHIKVNRDYQDLEATLKNEDFLSILEKYIGIQPYHLNIVTYRDFCNLLIGDSLPNIVSDEKCIDKITDICNRKNFTHLLPSQVFALLSTFLRGRPELRSLNYNKLNEFLEHNRNEIYNIFSSTLLNVKGLIQREYEQYLELENINDRADASFYLYKQLLESDNHLRLIYKISRDEIIANTKERLGDCDRDLNAVMEWLRNFYSELLQYGEVEKQAQDFINILNGSHINKLQLESLKNLLPHWISRFGTRGKIAFNRLGKYLPNPIIIVDEVQDLSSVECDSIVNFWFQLPKIPRKSKLMFFGDLNQQMSPTGFRWDDTRKNIAERCKIYKYDRERYNTEAGFVKDVNDRTTPFRILNNNYRTTWEIAELTESMMEQVVNANLTGDLRKYCLGNIVRLNDTYPFQIEQAYFELKEKNPELLIPQLLIGEKKYFLGGLSAILNEVSIEETVDGIEAKWFVVIAEDINDLSIVMKEQEVLAYLSILNCKGLEFDSCVIYGLPQKTTNRLEPDIIGQWYTALTRSRIKLLIYLTPEQFEYIKKTGWNTFTNQDEKDVIQLTLIENKAHLKEENYKRILTRFPHLSNLLGSYVEYKDNEVYIEIDKIPNFQRETLGASYTITDLSLKKLALGKQLHDDVFKKLEGIRDLEVIGQENFLNFLKNTIGNEQFTKYKSLILKQTVVHRAFDEIIELSENSKKVADSLKQVGTTSLDPMAHKAFGEQRFTTFMQTNDEMDLEISLMHFRKGGWAEKEETTKRRGADILESGGRFILAAKYFESASLGDWVSAVRCYVKTNDKEYKDDRATYLTENLESNGYIEQAAECWTLLDNWERAIDCAVRADESTATRICKKAVNIAEHFLSQNETGKAKLIAYHLESLERWNEATNCWLILGNWRKAISKISYTDQEHSDKIIQKIVQIVSDYIERGEKDKANFLTYLLERNLLEKKERMSRVAELWKKLKKLVRATNCYIKANELEKAEEIANQEENRYKRKCWDLIALAYYRQGVEFWPRASMGWKQAKNNRMLKDLLSECERKEAYLVLTKCFRQIGEFNSANAVAHERHTRGECEVSAQCWEYLNEYSNAAQCWLDVYYREVDKIDERMGPSHRRRIWRKESVERWLFFIETHKEPYEIMNPEIIEIKFESQKESLAEEYGFRDKVEKLVYKILNSPGWKKDFLDYIDTLEGTLKRANMHDELELDSFRGIRVLIKGSLDKNKIEILRDKVDKLTSNFMSVANGVVRRLAETPSKEVEAVKLWYSKRMNRIKDADTFIEKLLASPNDGDKIKGILCFKEVEQEEKAINAIENSILPSNLQLAIKAINLLYSENKEKRETFVEEITKRSQSKETGAITIEKHIDAKLLEYFALLEKEINKSSIEENDSIAIRSEIKWIEQNIQRYKVIKSRLQTIESLLEEKNPNILSLLDNIHDIFNRQI